MIIITKKRWVISIEQGDGFVAMVGGITLASFRVRNMIKARQVYNLLFLLLGGVMAGCSFVADPSESTEESSTTDIQPQAASLKVLGIMQDGGAPHIGCERPCCRNLFLRPAVDHRVVSLGISDVGTDGRSVGAIIESTPDFTEQLADFQTWSGLPLERIQLFLTHAHIGHYSGLMYLGREALGADRMPVWVMPRMREFLTQNGPWDQLVALQNIALNSLSADVAVKVGAQVSITPIRVPHRDEYSETVGFRIEGPHRSVLFIPDINKWSDWNRSLVSELKAVDRAYLDATFYDAAEVGYRDMAEIPHPFMVETMALLHDLPSEERGKVHFIHLNHTNPCLDSTSNAAAEIRSLGFYVATQGDVFAL